MCRVRTPMLLKKKPTTSDLDKKIETRKETFGIGFRTYGGYIDKYLRDI